MPFDATRVNPVVADLLKVRAYIAEHGFSPELWDHSRQCGCFIGTMDSLLILGVPAGDAIEGELIRRFGNADPEHFDDGVFDTRFLAINGVVNAAAALPIIDAAIARVS